MYSAWLTLSITTVATKATCGDDFHKQCDNLMWWEIILLHKSCGYTVGCTYIHLYVYTSSNNSSSRTVITFQCDYLHGWFVLLTHSHSSCSLHMYVCTSESQLVEHCQGQHTSSLYSIKCLLILDVAVQVTKSSIVLRGMCTHQTSELTSYHTLTLNQPSLIIHDNAHITCMSTWNVDLKLEWDSHIHQSCMYIQYIHTLWQEMQGLWLPLGPPSHLVQSRNQRTTSCVHHAWSYLVGLQWQVQHFTYAQCHTTSRG